jgi:HupE / UreJ protein
MPSRIAASRNCYFSRQAFLFATALFLGMPAASSAHDIPNDVTVQMFVKPQGDKLQILVRAPLKAMRDMEFPKRGLGFLDLERTHPLLPDAATLWLANFIDVYEGDRRLPTARVAATTVSLESDKSFASYEEALAHVTGAKLPANTDVYWNQVMLDALFEYPIRSDQSKFSIHPGLGRLGLRVVTVLRFSPATPDHAVRAFEFVGDPGLVPLDPRWHQAALRFVESGFMHILEGTDHLLFLFCLVIPFRRFRTLVPIVTSFTIAHSFTLIASAYNLAPDVLWFPPLIETLIAMSIVYMALENIVGGTTVNRRWMITFAFGLVHGFGFSFALRQSLQFAGSHLLTSLLSFNVGVELGQLLVLVLLIPVLDLLFKYMVAERMGTIILSALVAHTGWHWMIERGEILRQFRFEWPSLNAALLANVLFWLMLLAISAGLIWLAVSILRHRETRRVESKAADRA